MPNTDIQTEKQLYEQLRKNVENFSLNQETRSFLPHLINSIHQIEDTNKILQVVVNVLGDYFEADRCYIAITKNNAIKIIKEYRKSNDIPTVLGLDMSKLPGNYAKQLLLSNDIIFKENLYEDKGKDNPQKESFEYMKSLKINSLIFVPIQHNGKNIGVISFHTQKSSWEWQKDKKNFIKILGDYLGVIIFQGYLNNEINKSIIREQLSKTISLKIINSLNFSEVTETICCELKKILNAQRITMISIKNAQHPGNWNFLKTSDDKVATRFEHIPQHVKDIIGNFWHDTLHLGSGFYHTDDIQASDIPDVLKSFYSQLKVKSIAGILLYNNKGGCWCVVAAKDNSSTWSEAELELFISLKDTLSTALTNSEVYTQLKIQTERENMLRSEQSLLINKSLAKSLGLSTAMTYSILVNTYNQLKDTKKLDTKKYAYISFDEIKSQTFLGDFEQKNSLYKLMEKGLIECEKLSEVEIIYKTIEDEEYIKTLMIDPTIKKLKEKIVTCDIQKEDKLTISELNKSYSEYFPEITINAVNYFFKKHNPIAFSYEKIIAKNYYAVICRALDEFIEYNNLTTEDIIAVLNYLFNDNKCDSQKTSSVKKNTKTRGGHLKKLLFYRLYESRLLATDLISKMDLFSSPERMFSDNVTFLNAVLPEKNKIPKHKL